MTLYEIRHVFLSPFFTSLHVLVHRMLKSLIRSSPSKLAILDVGGRRSPYTVGLDASIVISELPRQTEVQEDLDLGLTKEMLTDILASRSNILEIILDDMTQSSLSDNTFDCIVAVEVLEHVEQDSLFLKEVYRVLKPGGTFLMTTPNGDYVENTNPDHKRHYTQKQLRTLLEHQFGSVETIYAVRTGILLRLGWMKPWSIKRPFRTIAGMVANRINLILSSQEMVKQLSSGTAHHIAMAKKH